MQNATPINRNTAMKLTAAAMMTVWDEPKQYKADISYSANHPLLIVESSIIARSTILL